MYVYVSDKWNIIMKSDIRLTGLWNQYREFNTAYKMEDNIIFEWGKVVKYENSKQYIEDSNRYHLNKELEDEKRKNAELTTIANAKMRKDLELDVKWQEPDEYNKKIYLLKNMRWSQHS
jgi:hypothetical protein